MKTKSSLFIILILILLCSCEKNPMIRYGFDSRFNKDSRGLSVMAVTNNSGLITLMGTVKIDSGELIIELTDPDGISVFNMHSFSPDCFDIIKTFRTKKGYWKLQYTSIQGVGVIYLHLNIKE